MMKNHYSWFITTLVAGAGVYFMVDANESVRNTLSVLAFFVFFMYWRIEDEKAELKATNNRLWLELKELRNRLDRLEQ